MSSWTGPADDALEVTLDHELRLINEAIMLVATGGAPRTTVVGLRLGDELLGRAREMAAEAGVRLVPLWHADESGVDIAIERIEP